MHLRSIGLTLATLALVLVVACGGDSKGGLLSGNAGGSGSGATWDLARADDLAHAGLLVASDLPVSGWSVTDDKFKDTPSKSASCSEVDKLDTDSRTAIVARAKRKFAKEGTTSASPDIGSEITSSVEIYRDAKTVADISSRTRAIAGNDKLLRCFEDELREDGGKVVVKRGSPSAGAPNGGLVWGVDIELSAAGGTIAFHLESYSWQSGNAIIAVDYTVSKQSFSANVVKQAVAKQDLAAGDALKGVRKGSISAPVSTTGKPTSSTSGVGKVAKVEDTHRYVLKVEWTGPDLAGMQALVDQVQSVTGTPVSKAATTSIEIAGSYAKPDKSLAKYTANSISFSATTIGTQQWIQFGTTTQGPKTIRPLQFGAHAPAASFLTTVGENPTMGLLKCSGTESVNGVTARKCGFSQGDVTGAERQSFFDSYVSKQATVTVRAADVTRASVQAWVSQQTDQPVKIVVDLAGKESKGTAFTHRLEANVSDIGRPVDIAAPR